MKVLLLFASMLTGACVGLTQHPTWVEDLLSELECGLSLTDIAALTDREIREVEAKKELGSHRVDGRRADVWLGFESGGLVHVTTGYVDGFKSIRRSPQKNLCTGDLTFGVIVEWVSSLEGAEVYWDEQLIDGSAKSGLLIEAMAGKHELRVVKKGFHAISKPITLSATGPGTVTVTLTDPVSSK